jgi:hypothetical protein
MAAKPLACWICGRVVDLNTCKTDEHGLAVHDPCYVTRTILKSKPERVNPPVSESNRLRQPRLRRPPDV